MSFCLQSDLRAPAHGCFPRQAAHRGWQRCPAGGLALDRQHPADLRSRHGAHVRRVPHQPAVGPHSSPLLHQRQVRRTREHTGTAALLSFHPCEVEGTWLCSQKLIAHPYYNKVTEENDIALLELDRPLQCNNYIQLICVPDMSMRVSQLTDCYISGWGSRKARCDSATVLQEAKVHLINVSTCNSSEWYQGDIHTHNLCAGYPQGGIDSCQGDSGGPLMCKDNNSDFFWLVGVTSWGEGCGRAQRPGIYTSTQHFYNWMVASMSHN
uniref:Acrosin n=1 Tax=Amazona collaria TaxID=241587 RepID=A0A8B9G384_9PSIT